MRPLRPLRGLRINLPGPRPQSPRNGNFAMVLAFSPHFVSVVSPGACAPGWNGNAPLALKFRANSPFNRGAEQRPTNGVKKSRASAGCSLMFACALDFYPTRWRNSPPAGPQERISLVRRFKIFTNRVTGGIIRRGPKARRHPSLGHRPRTWRRRAKGPKARSNEKASGKDIVIFRRRLRVDREIPFAAKGQDGHADSHIISRTGLLCDGAGDCGGWCLPRILITGYCRLSWGGREWSLIQRGWQNLAANEDGD
jgi:hypothetical protein